MSDISQLYDIIWLFSLVNLSSGLSASRSYLMHQITIMNSPWISTDTKDQIVAGENLP